jgi:hypothetical protein
LTWARDLYNIEDMKKALIVSFGLIFASMATAQSWFKGTLDEALAQAKSENKPVLLDFYSYT